MKNSVKSALFLSLFVSAITTQKVMAIEPGIAALAGSSAALASLNWVYCADGSSNACGELLSSAVTISVLLAKEVHAVKADALLYAQEEVASPALLSVVEKIQAEALEQGKELSFDEVVDAINTI